MRSLVILVLAGVVSAEDWSGEWLTDLGVLTLKQDGDRIEGEYGPNQSLTGTVDGAKATVEWRVGRNAGTGAFEMADGAMAFTGAWNHGNGAFGGTWRGWKRDPKAAKGKPADFSGVWRSSLGIMVLEQKGDKLTGTYGCEGWSTVEGTVKGRTCEFTWKRIRWSGPAWIEMTPDGKAFFGRTEEAQFTKWLGQRLEGYEREVKPSAGKIVKGLSKNGLCYYARAPNKWRSGKKVDAVVLLHGSNWVSEGMVFVTGNVQDLGDTYMIVGIDGQSWNDTSEPDKPRQNYTYANWMGRSTYKGYPYTDRESPYLVHETVKELKELYKLDRVFVGGHSQGGYCVSALAMSYPETFAGALLMSCGIVIQAEPDAFDDADLRRAQREMAVAVVHGTADQAVDFSSGSYNFDRFRESAFPYAGFFTADVAHGYDFLPFADAIRWMDALTTTDAKALLAYGKKRLEERGWRDVAAVCLRAHALKKSSKAFKDLEAALDAEAGKDLARWTEAVKENRDASWIDGFLRWKEQFEFAPAAEPVMKEFAKLREAHDAEAERLIGEARKAFRENDQEGGWANYREVLDKHYCATRYSVVKRWVENRR